MSSISVQRQCRFSESCGRGSVPGCRSVGRWRLLGPCSVPGCRNGDRWNLFARGSVLGCRIVGRWRLRVPCSGHGCRNDARSRLFVRYNVRICRTCDRLHPCDPDRRPVRCRAVRVAKIRRHLHGRRAGTREGVKGFSACFYRVVCQFCLQAVFLPDEGALCQAGFPVRRVGFYGGSQEFSLPYCRQVMRLSGKDREAAWDGVSGNGGAVMCFRHGGV